MQFVCIFKRYEIVPHNMFLHCTHILWEKLSRDLTVNNISEYVVFNWMTFCNLLYCLHIHNPMLDYILNIINRNEAPWDNQGLRIWVHQRIIQAFYPFEITYPLLAVICLIYIPLMFSCWNPTLNPIFRTWTILQHIKFGKIKTVICLIIMSSEHG